jgi:DNA-binding NarL/FixJ family response regulator
MDFSSTTFSMHPAGCLLSHPHRLKIISPRPAVSTRFFMPKDTIDTRTAVTLVIAQSSNIECQLLADAIRRNRGFELLSYATTSEKLVATVCTHRPDVVLISARLQDGPTAGLAALQKLRVLRSQCRSVVLLDHNQPELVVEALRRGARGVFFRNDGATPELLKCIRCIHQGQIWINNRGVEHVIENLMQSPSSRLSKLELVAALSKREREVARLVAGGLSNREIAEALKLSEHTIKNYLFRIFDKLKLSNRTELVLCILAETKPSDANDDHLAPETMTA